MPSWWLRGLALAVIPLIFLGIGLVMTLGGDSDTSVLEVTLKPTPTSTALKPRTTAATSLVPTATSEAPQALTPETTPLPEPSQEAPVQQGVPAQQAPAQQAPAQQAPAQQAPAQPAQPPAAQPTEPPSPPPPPPPPSSPPTPVPIDWEQVCTDDASTVSGRVESHYRSQGYVSTTYEGMGEETFKVYFRLCMASDDGYVNIYDFCYEVEAWRYFIDQAAGAQEWLDDCLARNYF